MSGGMVTLSAITAEQEKGVIRLVAGGWDICGCSIQLREFFVRLITNYAFC